MFYVGDMPKDVHPSNYCSTETQILSVVGIVVGTILRL